MDPIPDTLNNTPTAHEPPTYTPIEIIDDELRVSTTSTTSTISTTSTTPSKTFYCYIISTSASPVDSKGRTYNGYTVDLRRRLRQHNGDIKGGARATRSGHGRWEYIAILTCPTWTAVRAMQHEWTIRYPTRRRPRPTQYQGPCGRIHSLERVCAQIPSEEQTSLHVHPDFMHLVNALDLPEHILVKPLAELPL